MSRRAYIRTCWLASGRGGDGAAIVPDQDDIV